MTQDFNMYTLHTTDTCTRDSKTPFTGNQDYSSTMCDVRLRSPAFRSLRA